MRRILRSPVQEDVDWHVQHNNKTVGQFFSRPFFGRRPQPNFYVTTVDQSPPGASETESRRQVVLRISEREAGTV